MHKSHIFVTIDGVDGVGKTTAAKQLAANGDFYYHKSPNGAYAQLRHEVDLRAAPVERYCFYRTATQFDSVQISDLLKTTSVVSDRYVASTAAYHIALDPRIKLIHQEEGLLKPDFSFLLTAHSQIRDRRILMREHVSSDKKLESDSKFLDQVADIFATLGLKVIDTSNLSPEEVVTEILAHIQKGGPP